MKRFFKKLFNWEKWPYDAIYASLGIAWLYYGFRARAFWFFTPVNPTLVFAGFEGGSKKEVYDQLPIGYYPTTLLVDPGDDIPGLEKRMTQVGLQFPVVVKPDSGMQGVLFRVIHNLGDLKQYHSKVGESYIVQIFVELPAELSVYYIRYPREKCDRNIGSYDTRLIALDSLGVT